MSRLQSRLSVVCFRGKIIFPARCLSSVYSPFHRHSRTRFLFYRAKRGGCHVPPLSLCPSNPLGGGMRERSFPCEIRCQICSPATHSAQSRLTCPAAQSAGCSTSTARKTICICWNASHFISLKTPALVAVVIVAQRE